MRQLAKERFEAAGRTGNLSVRPIRSLPDQHAVPTHQPSLHHRGDGRTGTGIATPLLTHTAYTGMTAREVLRAF